MNTINQKIYFLNYDLGLKHTGIESSALLRAQLFSRQFNFPVTILTYKYRSHLATEVEILKSRRKLPKSTIVLSVYDYFQQFLGHAAPDIFLGAERKSVPFKSNSNIRYLNDKGRLEAFAIYNCLNQRLHYINYFDNGVKRRRDYYHESGHLSCTQVLSASISDRVEQEIFYRYDRKICLIKEHFYNDLGKRSFTKYQSFDENGGFSGFLADDDAFVSYFLDQYFNQRRLNIYEDNHYVADNQPRQTWLLIDKNKFFYRPAMRLKAMLEMGRIKVITAIHNLHAVNYQEKETSRINIHYAAIFEDLKAADAVVVQTNIQRDDIVSRFGNTGNVYAIPHTYESYYQYRNKSVKRKPQQAVYFARYDVDKKHELAIEAFSQVVKVLPEAEFHCYGSGSRLAELKAMVKTLEMEKNIFLHNWCDDVAKEYESAALSIISSPSESFSLTIAESLAHGCPVVGFDVPYGPKELIQSDENGYLVPYQDTQMMADKIIQIMQDPKLQERLSDNARNSAIRYSEKVVGQLWLTLLQEIDAV